MPDIASSETELIKNTCPSCGADSSQRERIEAGDVELCPICGTSMSATDAADVIATEQTISGLERTSAPTDSLQETKATTSSSPQRPTSQPLASSASPPHASASVASLSGKKSTETILLERLINEPKVTAQLPMARALVILAAVLAVGFLIYSTTKTADQYASAKFENPVDAADSSALFQKRFQAQQGLDSLKAYVATNPSDPKARLSYADHLYDAEYWAEAKEQFAAYLKSEPKDADARVDYAFSIAQADNDVEGAIAQLNKTLEYQPDHVNALFNAGILSLREVQGANHADALVKAKGYFERARKAAEIKNPDMVPQIDKILSEMENVGKTPPAIN